MKAHLLMSAGQVGAQEEGSALRNPSQHGHQQLHREQWAVRGLGRRSRDRRYFFHTERTSATPWGDFQGMPGQGQ